MFTSIDKDNSGEISVEELVPVMFTRATPVDVRDISYFVLDNGEDIAVAKSKGHKKEFSQQTLEELRMLFEVRFHVS